MINVDVTVIGGGPGGIAAALSAKQAGAKTLLIERERRLGGILKQCIHDGFGLIHFGEKLSGPEYAERFIEEFNSENIEALTLAFVTRIESTEEGYILSAVNRDGVVHINTRAIVLATGCRERTAKQVFIHGTRPSGVFTAGTAQHLVNLLGQLPTKKCVILGSGDIGLIMARRLTLEGAKVLGVYEAKPTPSGLMRNIHQCLYDYDIPLHLSKTVTRVFGRDRLSAVEICSVDEKMCPIEGTNEIVECDGLILSVGLIPENELAEDLGVQIDPRTGGPVCNEKLMTSRNGIFSCGNALHVNDLVDYVSESGEIAGRSAAAFAKGEKGKGNEIEFQIGKNLLYMVPQRLSLSFKAKKTVLYFRSRENLDKCVLKLLVDGIEVFRKKYSSLRPPEMERIELDFGMMNLTQGSKVAFEIEEG